MARPFAAIRPGERRDTWAAFLTLFGFIASHSVLETARDALFLSKVPAQRLPWVYLAIAAASLGVARAQSALGRVVTGRRALSVWTLLAAAVTLAFWASLGALGPAGLYGLYVWSGVLTSLVLVHFWTLLGELFSVTQAKRLYGVIGAGSVLGAIAGSAAASGLARALPPARLVLVAAAGFGLTALLPLAFGAGAGHSAPKAKGAAATGVLDDARFVARQPYVRSVAGVLVASATALTLADYLFKSTVAAHVPRAELGAYLATVYLVLNVLSLASQLFLVGWLVRRAGLGTALAVLPALLVLGGVGLAAGGGLAAALLVKGADGALRYSLHRTSTELLFVPLGEEARRRMKAFLDVLGQRGGQAAASVAILGAAALGAPPAVLAGALVVLAAAWVAGALRLRGHYLELFRGRLREGRIEHVGEFPELDVASLETLVAALDSSNDAEVLAALDVLERERKGRLVPALILYHPSVEVVERALSIFARAGKKSVVAVVDRLLEHESPRVRAAALAARSLLAPDARLLNHRLSLDDSPEVRATIVVQLIAMGEILGAEAEERLERLLRSGSRAVKIALAEAIALRDAHGFDRVVTALSHDGDAEVRLAAVAAMTRMRSPAFLAPLIEQLGDERTRPRARAALTSYGEAGLAALDEALRDAARPAVVRWQLPRTVSLFDPQRAAEVLLAHLPEEPDGMVRYRSIRALEGLVARNPTLRLDQAALGKAIDGTVARAYRYLDRRLSLVRGAAREPRRATPGHELLVKMLHDKEDNAVGRLFRLLGLLHPTEDFAQIYRGLRSGKREARASSVELCENVLPPPLRQAVLGLIDDLPDEERLLASGRYHAPRRLEYDELLATMLESTSEALQDLTAYHVGELGLASFRERIDRLRRADPPRTDVERALEVLGATRGLAEEAPAC